MSDWTEPGAFEVSPGVHRIPLPLPNDGLRSVNVYAIATDDGLVCVDAGWAIEESREQLATALASIGAGLGDIRRFLVTHVHRDHYTQGPVLRREFGTTVSLGLGDKPTLDLLQQPDRSPLIDQLEQLTCHGAVELADLMGSFMRGHRVDQGQWESPDEWLTGGPVALAGGRVLDAVETPGHTAGHLVFHDTAAGVMFTGDHVLPTITPSIGFEPAVTEDPLGAFLSSLRVVRERPDAVLLPAHGPVADSVHARVDELIAHHGRRLEQSLAAVHQGATSAFEAAGVLRWTRREHKLASLDPFNAMLAVFETGAHLDLLAAQGTLTRTTDDQGVRRYA
ncbi:MAG: MBL fold metallo-hydrolase [Mycobacteriales bacterium]|nr:MBL fold metallo-hydrolase [Mycobacteriales bacterium]